MSLKQQATEHKLPQTKFTIEFTVLTTALIIGGLVAGVALWMNFFFSVKLATQAAAKQFTEIGEVVGEKVTHLDSTGLSMIKLLYESEAATTQLIKNENMRLVALMARSIEHTDGMYSVFIGYPDGGFFQLTNLESTPRARIAWQAAPIDRWLVTRVIPKENGAVLVKKYMDDKFNVRIEKTESTEYDPTIRPWFKLANLGEVRKTPPYFFSFLQEPGMSYSIKTKMNSVIGIEVTLSSLKKYIRNTQFPNTSQAFLFDASGRVRVSHTVTEDKESFETSPLNLTPQEKQYLEENPLQIIANEPDYPPFDFTVSGIPRGFSVDLIELQAKIAGFRIRYNNGLSFQKLLSGFNEGEIDVMLAMRKTENREKYGFFGTPIVQSKIVIVQRKVISSPIESLADLKGLRIAVQKNYVVTEYLKKKFPDFQYILVNDALTAMNLISENKADALVEMKTVADYVREHYFLSNLVFSKPLKEFNQGDDFSLHQYITNGKPELLSILNKSFAAISEEQLLSLKRKWAIGERISASSRVQKQEVGQLPIQELLNFAKSEKEHQKLREIDIENERYFVYVTPIDKRSNAKSQEFLGMLVSQREVIETYLDQIKSALVISLFVLLLLTPLILYLSRLIVVPIRELTIENDKIVNRQFDQVNLVNTRIRELSELSRSICYMSTSIKEYQESHRELLESFITLIAQAIDQKSPHTSGHCERVPELAIMLAEAACKSKSDAFEKFDFATEDEWREFKIASWMHDCGKVTTPEHIVEKGSKLEVIYNRIHEVRMRFEVLWRDAEIDYWKNVAQTPEKERELKQTMNLKINKVIDDFAFVALCNQGSESMSEEQLERLASIAEQTWQKRLDDNLGLSPVEELSSVDNKPTLPAFENVLLNKASHLCPRRSVQQRDEKFGFNMEAPTHLYNQGELYNLSIQRGTLTKEDRYIINEHIINTIQMLETLPLPDDLKRVPEYAGGHHETLKGTGYPRGLKGENLSIPARILTIADIFEALTASDRPYKKAKSLSESLKIMSYMVINHHIDGDLFRLFLTEGVYLKYAERFIQKEQIDDIDIQEYIDLSST